MLHFIVNAIIKMIIDKSSQICDISRQNARIHRRISQIRNFSESYQPYQWPFWCYPVIIISRSNGQHHQKKTHWPSVWACVRCCVHAACWRAFLRAVGERSGRVFSAPATLRTRLNRRRVPPPSVPPAPAILRSLVARRRRGRSARDACSAAHAPWRDRPTRVRGRKQRQVPRARTGGYRQSAQATRTTTPSSLRDDDTETGSSRAETDATVDIANRSGIISGRFLPLKRSKIVNWKTDKFIFN